MLLLLLTGTTAPQVDESEHVLIEVRLLATSEEDLLSVGLDAGEAVQRLDIDDVNRLSRWARRGRTNEYVREVLVARTGEAKGYLESSSIPYVAFDDQGTTTQVAERTVEVEVLPHRDGTVEVTVGLVEPDFNQALDGEPALWVFEVQTEMAPDGGWAARVLEAEGPRNCGDARLVTARAGCSHLVLLVDQEELTLGDWADRTSGLR